MRSTKTGYDVAQDADIAAVMSNAAQDIGSFIRTQREAAQVSVRQLAEKAGVSNPYLSQIERGLRKPSADVLNQIAKALRVSAEVLYVRAGILEPSAAGGCVTPSSPTSRSPSGRSRCCSTSTRPSGSRTMPSPNRFLISLNWKPRVRSRQRRLTLTK